MRTWVLKRAVQEGQGIKKSLVPVPTFLPDSARQRIMQAVLWATKMVQLNQ